MRNMNSTVGKPSKVSKVLMVIAAVLAVYAILRLAIPTSLISGFGDVIAVVLIALLLVYFSGKCCREQHEQEVEEADEQMLAEAPVLAQPTQAAPAPVAATTSPEATATEAAKQFVAPSYRNGMSIKDAQMYVDGEKIAIMEQSETVNQHQSQIDEAARKRSQLVADYNATFGRQATPAAPAAPAAPATPTAPAAPATPAAPAAPAAPATPATATNP